MDIGYSSNPRDFKRYTTQQMWDVFLRNDLYNTEVSNPDFLEEYL